MKGRQSDSATGSTDFNVGVLSLSGAGVVAPHWRGEPKGHGVAVPSGVPLVEVAGSGERNAGLDGRTRGRSGTVRASGTEEGGAFIKGGLVSGG